MAFLEERVHFGRLNPCRWKDEATEADGLFALMIRLPRQHKVISSAVDVLLIPKRSRCNNPTLETVMKSGRKQGHGAQSALDDHLKVKATGSIQHGASRSIWLTATACVWKQWISAQTLKTSQSCAEEMRAGV